MKPLRLTLVALIAVFLSAAPAAAVRWRWQAAIDDNGILTSATLVGSIVPSGRLLGGRWRCPGCTRLPTKAHARHLACWHGEPTVELGRYCTLRGFTPVSSCFTYFEGTLVCTQPFNVARVVMWRVAGGF